MELTDENRLIGEEMSFSTLVSEMQRVYNCRIQESRIPEVLKYRFQKAAVRFYTDDIDSAKMHVLEEIGDLTYQLVKYIAVKSGVLTPNQQRMFYNRHADRLDINENLNEENSNHLIEEAVNPAEDDRVSERTNIDFKTLYLDAYSRVDGDDIETMSSKLPQGAFPGRKYKRVKEFLATQYVAGISRKLRQANEDPALTPEYHSTEFLKNERIPEEVAELVEVLNTHRYKANHATLIRDATTGVSQASQLMQSVNNFYSATPDQEERKAAELLSHLDGLLRVRLNERLHLEDALDYCLLKIKGRQELTFKGYAHPDVMKACRPIEYFIEADVVH